MIGQLTGKVVVKNDYVLVQTGSGVGYKVWVGEKILQRGEREVETLWIHSYIKEDRFELYGFESEVELSLFELLLGVSGCGPKTALMIVGGGSEGIVTAVQEARVSFFTSFPRVGKKLAQKLIIELKNKLGGVKDLDLTAKSQIYTDVTEALAVLGFTGEPVDKVLAAMKLEDLTTGEAVKVALKKLRE